MAKYKKEFKYSTEKEEDNLVVFHLEEQFTKNMN